MGIAIDDPGLEHLWIVYPGDEAYSMDGRISTLAVAGIPGLAVSLAGNNSPH